MIENAVSDFMLSPRLTFRLAIAENLQPFLAEFRTESLMFPFLGAALEDLLWSLMGRFVKSDVMRSTDGPFKLMKVDVHSFENAIAVTIFDVHCGTKNALCKVPKLLLNCPGIQKGLPLVCEEMCHESSS